MTAEGTAETVEGIVAAEEMEAVEPVEQQVSSSMSALPACFLATLSILLAVDSSIDTSSEALFSNSSAAS